MMVRIHRDLVFSLALVCGVCSAATGQSDADKNTKYPDPTRFEDAIKEFEASDAVESPPQSAVLCIGSSTMRKWHDKISDDLAPLTVIARGFGGSTTHDLLHYTDRVVLPYKPRAILVYEGDNDVAQGVGPDEIVNTFRQFVNKVHGVLPQTRIFFMSIKPSHKRWSMWETMTEANRKIAHVCDQDRRLHFIDISTALLDKEGQPRRLLFADDDLHLNRAGYEAIRDVVCPVLMKHELQFEKKAIVE